MPITQFGLIQWKSILECSLPLFQSLDEDNKQPEINADDDSTPEERPPDGDGPDEDNKQPEINEAAGQKRDDEEGRKTIIFNPICGAVI